MPELALPARRFPPPRPPQGGPDRSSALDALSLDVWQNCAFTSLLGYREVCALACCSKALLALMTNELIWRELFTASKNLPALSTITHWREAFKERTLVGARWRMDSMVRSKASWKWFVSRCMSSRVPHRIGMHFRTLRVCRATYNELQHERFLARGGVVGIGHESHSALDRVPILPQPLAVLADGAGARVGVGARPPVLPGSASSAPELPAAAVAYVVDFSADEPHGTAAEHVGTPATLDAAAVDSEPPPFESCGRCAGGNGDGCADCTAVESNVCFDKAGRRVFARISDAIAAAAPLDRILIEPGEYFENIAIDKPLELIGAESASPVVIRGDCTAATAWLTASCRLSHLTLTQGPATADSPILATILASAGLHVCIDECDISSQAGHSVVVKGARTKASICHNRIHSSRGVGVLFCDESTGQISDCVIYSNKRAGVAILRGGAPHVSANLIRDGEDSGVLVSEAGRGRVEGNLIRSNTRAGVAVLQAGQPHVLENTIICGKDSGVLVCEGGEGVIEHNLIAANRIAGVAVCSGASPHVLHNRIGRGQGRALCVADGCHPLVEHNTLEATSEPSSLAVPAGLRPTIAMRNRVADAPVVDQLELTALLAASLPAAGASHLVGARSGTDSSALDDTLSPLGLARATRRTATILNTIVLKRTRIRSI
ncbi:hypothetical protein KFE25_004704 [Diacronema lutheri]|uniref:Right handed beta helix domain-containing protein n=1 Tax=Diacronema lutheri TaxID=2081491 RepID=A0A8J6CCQ7_DIALT|nr:hypothetical protein KFE25_004704 [Diacronema lutheri]